MGQGNNFSRELPVLDQLPWAFIFLPAKWTGDKEAGITAPANPKMLFSRG